MRTFKGTRPCFRFALLALAALALAGCPSEDDSYVCGNGVCEVSEGEDRFSCPQDCAPNVCGNTICDAAETVANCPQDCPAVCGDNLCTDAENSDSCRRDCPELCGDGYCSDNEDLLGNCPADCPIGPVCGDGFCEGGETGANCPSDCATCTGQYPVDCHDGTGCWSAGTNCASNVFTCGGQLRRCALTSNTAFCCSNAFVQCPASFPYYCPVDNLCYAQVPTFCSTATCSFILGDC